MKQLAFIAVLITKLFTAHSQNIGIGITNPARAKLEVNGTPANSATVAIFGGESTGISLQRNWPSIGWNQYYNQGSKYIGNGFAAVQYLDPLNGGIFTDLFSSGTANALCSPPKRVMAILQSGSIAFHGTTHNSIFNSGSDENTYIRAGKNGGQVIINDISDGEVLMYGPVRITGTPGYLNVKGNIGITDRDGFDTWHFVVNGVNGNLELVSTFFNVGSFNQTNGNYSSISDSRLKKNITGLSSLLSKIMLLQPVEYDMKFGREGENKSIGFIAQDVKKLFPELVSTVKGEAAGYKDLTDVHSLNYSGFGVIAIKAIQEQQQTIQALQSKIEALETNLNMLVKSISQDANRLK